VKQIFFLIKISVFIYFTSFSIVNAKIVYVDLDKILATSIAGSSLLKTFKELDQKNIVKFQDNEKDLKSKEDELIAQKNILSEVDFKNKLNKLRAEIKTYNQNRQKVINENNKFKLKNTNKFLMLINPILTKYSDENKISLILKKKDIVIGKSDLDITDKIIELVNKSIKKVEIK
jgi:Skp family chaperone for outer membrane proteins